MFITAAPAFADSVRGIRPASANPIAPRGSVMMVPLTAERAGDNWPRVLDVRLADGTRLRADVAWVHPITAARPVRRWTDDPRRLGIRAIDRHDDSSRFIDFTSGLGPYMLLRLPDGASGSMRVESTTINPVWVDVPWTDPLLLDQEQVLAALPPGGGRPTMQMIEAPDRPDPQSPFEYWRWVLLADRMAFSPPPPTAADAGDDIARMAAEHTAALWRIAIGRLARASPRIAMECRQMLTHIALDRGKPMAAWTADPQQVAILLAALLDFSRGDEVALGAAVAWLDQQTPLMLWPENESGDIVRIAMTSLRPGPLPVRLQWVGADPREHPPSAVQLESGVIVHVSVDRLPLSAAIPGRSALMQEPPLQVLRITTDADAPGGGGGRSFDLACGPRVTEARPPGVTFPPLTHPLTLADVQLNMARPSDPDRATLAQVRRLSGRWEVFFECRRIVEQQQRIDPSSIRTLEDLRGIEAITLLLGPEEDAPAGGAGGGGPAIWLTIPEHDWPITVGIGSHPDLRVHKRSFADRWTCRVVLPDQWFSAAETNPALIAFIRSHGDSRQVETGPAPSPPWRITPGRAAIDLGHWDDLPTANQ